MEVTSVKPIKVDPRSFGVCGEFSVVLDDELIIRNIRVVSGKEGLFIAFPNTGSDICEDGKRRFHDIVHPLNNSLRQMITKEVLSAYGNEVRKKNNIAMEA